MKSQKEILEIQFVKGEIRRFILSNFLPGDDEESLCDDDLLFEGGIIDSAGAMTFISFLEENYGIQILDEELFPENFASVGQIVHFVLKKLKDRIMYKKTTSSR